MVNQEKARHQKERNERLWSVAKVAAKMERSADEDEQVKSN